MSTYTPVASQTLSASSASITFNNIPQSYTSLILICWTKMPQANEALSMQFNGDTSTNYSYTQLSGSGTTAASNRGTNQTYARFGNNLQTTGGFTKADIQNYSSGTTNKTILSRSGHASSGGTVAFVNTWRNTNPITSIKIFPETLGNFASGTTIHIYGISAGSQKAQGGIVTTDGTYWYHTFRGSGLFSTRQAINVDYLVIAGGGAGSAGQTNNSIGAGGGAGGLRSSVGSTGGGGSLGSALSLSADTNYSVIVGSGGAASTYVPNYGGASGNNSQFSTIISTGGGGGGGHTGPGAPNGDGVSGGSGGGGRMGSRPGGAGTANQGYAGGNGGSVSGGGGGGAGGAGGAGSGTNGGGGGSSLTISSWASPTSTGVSSAYAGGGGGSTDSPGSAPAGGGGGAGNGSAKNNGNATSATANTGSGGGGGTAGNGANQWGANGGSGLVILRYTV